MQNLTRRSILTGIAALIATPAIVRASNLMPIKSYIPILYGDGIHCDADAIMACLNGQSFRKANNIYSDNTFAEYTAEPGILGNGRFLVNKPLIISNPEFYLYNSHFTAGDKFPEDGTLLNFPIFPISSPVGQAQISFNSFRPKPSLVHGVFPRQTFFPL